MRKITSYLAGLGCLWGFAGGALAESPESEISVPGLVEEPLEVHIFTPPKEQLKGPDIQVMTWSPETPGDQYIIVNTWEPGQPDGIRVINDQNNDPAKIQVYTWSPATPGDRQIVVHTWEPGERSLIRVHGPE